jgi:hypothetical protein
MGGGRGGRNARRSGGSGFGGLSSLSATAVKTLTACRNDLATQCAELQDQISALEGVIGRFKSSGGGAAARRPAARRSTARRPSGARPAAKAPGGTLKEYIARVLGSANSAMRLMEVSSAVRAAGYPTQGKNFSNQVSMALAAMVKKKQVRKLDRGKYRA